jgi:hypothetical protein
VKFALFVWAEGVGASAAAMVAAVNDLRLQFARLRGDEKGGIGRSGATR